MAYEFTGADSHQLTTSSTTITGSPLTIAAWARPTAGVEQSLVSIEENTNNHRVTLQVTNTYNTRITVTGVTSTQTLPTTATVASNTWNHYCCTVTSNTARAVYLNGGNALSQVLNTGVSNVPTRITIGAGLNNSYFTGSIAEVGIWNAVLNVDEINSLAKGMACDRVRPQNLVFYAPLVRDLIDVSNGLTITNNNNTTITDHPRIYK